MAWAITVHKSQGLTLDKAVIDIGQRDFAPGITYVALSRVRNLDDCLIQSFDFQRIAHLNKSKTYKRRLIEDRRLAKLAKRTESIFSANDTISDFVYDFFTKSEEEQQELPELLDSDDNSDASDLEENTSPIIFKGTKRSDKQSNTVNSSLKPPTTTQGTASPSLPPLRNLFEKYRKKLETRYRNPRLRCLFFANSVEEGRK